MLSDEKVKKFQTIIDDIRVKTDGDLSKATIADIIVLHDIALESYYENIENWKQICYWANLDVDAWLESKDIDDEWVEVFNGYGSKIGKFNRVSGEYVELK